MEPKLQISQSWQRKAAGEACVHSYGIVDTFANPEVLTGG